MMMELMMDYVIDGIEKFPGNKLWIYNRWGNLVYKAKGLR
jgi:lauroyl/myristoyl acyltransferase